MSKYAVFAGGHYYPSGGWRDFKKHFHTEEEERAYASNLIYRKERDYDWVQVVLLEEGLVVLILENNNGTVERVYE